MHEPTMNSLQNVIFQYESNYHTGRNSLNYRLS